jgi:FkbM family methyltransferase
MSSLVKEVELAGIMTRFEGENDDPSFKRLHEVAKQHHSLASFVDRNIPAGATFLDIGANIGLTAILLARRAERIIAYEASPVNARHLRANLTLNNITNVDVVERAVSASAGELHFHVDTFGPGSHVVSLGHLAGDRTSHISVPAVSLDSQDLPLIAFMKIDVEGHEPEVLAGAAALLARDRPMIYTEINLWCLCAFGNHSPGAYVRSLWNAFEVWEVGESGSLAPITDSYQFLHDLIVKRHGITDVVMRPRENYQKLTLPELTWPPQAVVAAAASGSKESRRIWTAQAQLDAVVATATMNVATCAMWCQERALSLEQLNDWRVRALSGLDRRD